MSHNGKYVMMWRLFCAGPGVDVHKAKRQRDIPGGARSPLLRISGEGTRLADIFRNTEPQGNFCQLNLKSLDDASTIT